MGLFHQYDIRGIYGKDLTEDFAYDLGNVLMDYTDAKTIVIGHDSRIGNLALFSAISKAILSRGINITYVGLVTRPMLNWIAWKHSFELGIYITASHNPAEYNGFKFIWNGKPLYYDNGLNDVEKLLADRVAGGGKYTKNFITIKQTSNITLKNSKKIGKVTSIDYIDDYVKFLSKHLSAEFRSYIRGHTVRIIADASNGSAGEIIKRFLLNNDITYELLFTHPDGTFYGHNPNPLNPDAPRVISKKIPIFKADFGFIVDPDADRILFIDDTGCVVENNYLDCLVVEDLLRKHKHSSVVYDLVSRRILSETIKKGLGKAVVSKVGTSNMITAMKSNKAVFGSEMSGHRYFGFMNNQDSGLMMLVHVLNTLYSKKYCKHKLSTLVKKYDKYVDLGELNYSLSGDSKKKLVLDKIVKYYSDNKKKLFVKQISQLDGVSIITKNYWFNIRPSNTEPLLRLRLEGHDKKTLLAVKFTIEKFLK